MIFISKTMFILKIIVFYLTSSSVDSVFIKSREPDTWENAREYCKSFGGNLATLNNIEIFRDDVREQEITLTPGEELWVGASLKYGPWTWSGDSEQSFKEKYFVRRGCLRLDTESNGTVIEALTPLKCLDHCGWSGQVGLKENHCFCQDDLGNTSSNRPGVCHIRCSSTSSHMCGGYSAISMYKPGQRDLNWAKGEPKDDNDCTLLRIGGIGSRPEFVTGNCDMQTRYLCSFSNNDKCGSQYECTKASSYYATWRGAINKCHNINGTFSDLQEPLSDDIFNDIHQLPRGSFWVALHRDRHWQWLNGSNVDMTYFQIGRQYVLSQTCATVKMIGNVPTLTGRQCQQKLHFICQYDYMAKREKTDLDRHSTVTMATPEYGLMADDASVGNYETKDEDPPEEEPSSGGVVFTCMYMILGFVSGMLCVLAIGLIVYLICRCKQPNDNKPQPLDGESRRTDAHSISYSSKDESIHISPPTADITYDTVYDLETESPFRRTQRLIRMGSANSWRHAPTRRTDSNATHSPRTGYTWRGMIGGGIEIINTELRHSASDQSDYREASIASLYDGASYNQTRAVIENRRGSSPNDFEQIEVLYDLPERSDSFDYESRKAQQEKCAQAEGGASFLELRTARNSGSHEENIYATIKKTFQKIEEEIAEQARKDNLDIKTDSDN